MNPDYVCEVYILYLIEELDSATEKRFMSKLEKMNAPYDSIGDFMREYEAEESIYIALIDWVKEEWTNAQQQKKKITPKQFAKQNVSGFLSSLS